MHATNLADTIPASAHYLDTTPAASDPCYADTPAYADAVIALRAANRVPDMSRLGVLGLTAVWTNLTGEQVEVESTSDLLALSILATL